MIDCTCSIPMVWASPRSPCRRRTRSDGGMGIAAWDNRIAIANYDAGSLTFIADTTCAERLTPTPTPAALTATPTASATATLRPALPQPKGRARHRRPLRHPAQRHRRRPSPHRPPQPPRRHDDPAQHRHRDSPTAPTPIATSTAHIAPPPARRLARHHRPPDAQPDPPRRRPARHSDAHTRHSHAHQPQQPPLAPRRLSFRQKSRSSGPTAAPRCAMPIWPTSPPI